MLFRSANQYANSYKQGLIEPDKVDERVRQIGDALTRAATTKENADFRQQQLAQSLQIAQGNQAIALGNQQIQSLLAQIKAQAEANKPEQFSYTQKKDIDLITELKDESRKAATNASIAQRAAPLIEQAYTGKVEAGIKGLAGAVGISTEAKIANDQLAQLSNQLAVNAPKFSGPTSDRDAARYDAAVGDLANPSKTPESKKAALKEIQNLSTKAKAYATQAENYFADKKTLRGFEFKENPYDGM